MTKAPALLAPPGITLTDVCLRFQHKTLFDHLSLELMPGKITCLLGPSGVGKTTLLRMLASLPLFGRGHDRLASLPRHHEKPHAGRPVTYDKQKGEHGTATLTTTDQQPLCGRVAYMAQTDLLLPWLSLHDNVMLGSYLRGNKPDVATQHKALSMLDSVGLAAEAQHKPGTLSSGMKQRAALARTLMEEQPVVLMDEPFSALDAITRYTMQTLAAQKLAGKTVLLITHDPWEALRLADVIFVLRGQPATLSSPIMPPCLPPRDVTDLALLPLQKRLLHELHMVEAL